LLACHPFSLLPPGPAGPGQAQQACRLVNC